MTSNILGKSNKLEIMVIKTKLPHPLKSVKNLQSQLEAISAHLHSHDCAHVMCVVLPVNLYESSEIHEKTYDLLRDYVVLPDPVMANATNWINMKAKQFKKTSNLSSSSFTTMSVQSSGQKHSRIIKNSALFSRADP
jgi:hypothetical protein